MITKDGDVFWLGWGRARLQDNNYNFFLVPKDDELDKYYFPLGSEEPTGFPYNYRPVRLTQEIKDKWKLVALEKINTDEFLQMIKEIKRTILAKKIR